MEFQEMGDRFATLFKCALDSLSASYLDRQCMHIQLKSQPNCSTNITRNTFITNTSREHEMAQFVIKNSTFGYFDGTNPITGRVIQLRSPSSIIAPAVIEFNL